MDWMPIAFAVALAGALAGCKSKEPPPLAPSSVSPVNFSAAYDGIDGIALSWAAPGTRVDAYLLEISDGVHPFQRLGDPIPGTVTRVRVFLQGGIPEGLRLYFALTATQSGNALGPPATTDFLEPLRPLVATSAEYTDGGILVSWSTDSRIADRVEIARQHFRLPADAGNAPPEVVAVPAADASWLDGTLEEATTYVYTLTLKAGSFAGTPVSATASTPLLPPRDLIATGRAGGVDLVWTNQSAAAAGVEVKRFPGPSWVIADLPADAGSYRDLPPSPGLYTYRIEAVRPGYLPAGTEDAGIAPPRGALLFDATVLPAVTGLDAVRNGRGEWSVCGSQGVVDLSGTRPTFDQSLYASPCVLLDPAQQPHHPYAVFIDAGTAMTFFHAWFDGAQWQTEEVASETGLGGAWLALDGLGQAHAIWETYDVNNRPVSLHYAHRTAGGWVAEPVSLTLTGHEFPLDLQVDGTGAVHLVTYPALDHLERSPAGVWTRESLPLTFGATERPVFAQLRVLGTSDLLLPFVWNDWLQPEDRLEVLVRRDGGWSGPEVVDIRDTQAPSPTFRVATVPGTGRTALAYVGSDGGTLFVRSDGGWSRSALGSEANGVMGLGFDEQGRIHGLQLVQDPALPQSFQRDATFDEVP